MVVQFPPELERKLNRIAVDRGQNAESLVQEAVERLINYDEWFLREVEKGLDAADRGELVEHEAVGKTINSRYPG
ncbi:MAG TPA: hypothetical protein VGZ73_02625 [Bryobacteraceae bacterium]|jgi:predicted transcriptional regulator|nr:hypothetical protein [Bryobacteraceae bacterium]